MHCLSEEPEITFVSGNVTVDEGTSVTLNCSATAFPAPTFTWIKLDGQLRDGVNGDNTSLLVIVNSTIDDNGMYVCVASNYGGNAQSQPVHLVVIQIYGKSALFL